MPLMVKVIVVASYILTILLYKSTVTANTTGNDQDACNVCKCKSKGHDFIVDCHYKGLTTLPMKMPTNTTKLYLQDNFLNESAMTDFEYLVPTLQELDISGNRYKKPFRIPPLLRNLIAADNYIEDINLFLLNGPNLEKM
ncbi:leucine-rich repeat transmembrane protein FLRT1-like [Amphiura filiformis]|uniref:leucine-rich repeat transmembrane protein FLRT1-like n=1 Tax=Amphiura filiformis TaxID=82378 RepID=UPI003B2117D4